MRTIKWTILGSLTLAVPAAMGSFACNGKGTVVYHDGTGSGIGQAGAEGNQQVGAQPGRAARPR